jgi:hypothetical protein
MSAAERAQALKEEFERKRVELEAAMAAAEEEERRAEEA